VIAADHDRPRAGVGDGADPLGDDFVTLLDAVGGASMSPASATLGGRTAPPSGNSCGRISDDCARTSRGRALPPAGHDAAVKRHTDDSVEASGILDMGQRMNVAGCAKRGDRNDARG
jgi:hypothetical protein